MTDITKGCDDPDCEDAVKAMYTYLDKETSDEDRSKIESHLGDCVSCFESFEFEAELKRVIATKCREEVPDHLYDRVRASLLAEIQDPSSASKPLGAVD